MLTYDLIIIGAGPAGLSASYQAKKRGLNYLCLEATNLVSTIYNYPLKKTLFAATKGIEIEDYTFNPKNKEKVYREEVIDYYNNIFDKEQLNIKLFEKVLAIEKKNKVFEIDTEKGAYKSINVILATGMQSCPRKLGIPGENFEFVSNRLTNPDLYQNKKVLVVGGGNTAVECALALIKVNAEVCLSYRKEKFFRLSEHNAKEILKEQKNDRIKILFNSNVKKINIDGTVEIEIDKKIKEFGFDYLFVLIGALPAKDFLTKIGLELEGLKPRYSQKTKMSTINNLFIAGDLTKEVLIPNAVKSGKEIVDYIYKKRNE